MPEDTSDDLPGAGESLWLATTPRTDYPPLDGDATVDVAVVGGGIAGLETALRLKEDGRTVAVIEAGRVVEGVTGHTTAKVTAQHGLKYRWLRSRMGADAAATYAEANQRAVEAVADRVDDLGVEGFRREKAYTYVESADRRRDVSREVEAASAAGLPAAFDENLDDRFGAAAAVRFDDQAMFHPRNYLLALADEIPGGGSHVFERTRATDVSDGEPCRVETDRGTVTANDVVVATHFPVFDRGAYFARMYPKRSYVLALRVAGDPPDGMYYRSGDPYFSVRTHRTDDETLVLVGGENHRTGEGDEAERYRRVERAARDRFDVEEVAYRWSTQDYVTADRVPFVGALGPRTDHLYTATGFGGWGMTGGVVAGMVLSDLVAGRENPWADLYRPSRLAPRASAGTFAKHNAEAGVGFVRDWLSRPAAGDPAALAPGEARVLRHDGERVAAHRDDGGTLHVVSAVCTHLDCIVAWNDAERSWDCPCHGSRFAPDGTVLDGPAVRDLPVRDDG